ncbi:acyl-ACP desaturase [Kitasatospora sp. LaBMicrA B282]|uniref:acyl-ACP desaturase n=1 Tax=Kitasatospora sp. LaBMicrA B282 TaxID=3420949 RepID=UPI003D12CEE5
MDAHLKAADDWYPHQFVPWSQGRDFEGVYRGEPWTEGEQALSPAVRAGLLHNLLSEENLPSYHRVIAEAFSRDGAWGTWVNRWTVEEGRHGMALRDYLLVTRAVDPVALEDARSRHVQHGYDLDYRGDALASLVYVTLQELATRVSYRTMRTMCGEPGCEALLKHIAQDENRHMIFYRTVLQAAWEIDPMRLTDALARVLGTFRAPGHAAPGFAKMAVSMVLSGIYTPTMHHEEVVLPILRFLKVFEVDRLGPGGEQARERLAAAVGTSAARAERFERTGSAQRQSVRSPAGA